MKRILTALAAGVLSLAAFAQDASVEDLRIYINPGHGSWTANDRPMAIRGHGPHSRFNTDTLSFFESNTNLRKGFGVLNKLAQLGFTYDPTLNQEGERHQTGAARDMENNLVMSHVKCGPYLDDNGTPTQLQADGKPIPESLDWYNRSLSEIDIEVDDNIFDMFISIHSNALNSDGKFHTTNFPIILYRGYDDCHSDVGVYSDFQQTSKAMAEKVWPYHMRNTHECWTAYSETKTNIRGDINFYGSSSTVRGYKGYLGVLKHGSPGFLIEGYFHQYAPAALRHMNWDVDVIEGINYAHGIADFFGIQKESTGELYGIVRDAHERINDDTYVPVPTHADFNMPLDNVDVVLKKGGNVVATYKTDNQFNGAFVFYNLEPGDYTIECTAEGYKEGKPVEVTVTAAEVVYPEVYLESESYVPPTIEYKDYPDELAGTAFGARDSYLFRTEKLDTEIHQLADKTVRRLLHNGDRLYILAYDAQENPYICILDDTTLEVLAEPVTTGMAGNRKNVADIAVTADGVLVATPSELCMFSDDQVEEGETRGTLNVYRWENDAENNNLPKGEPVLWMSTQLSGNLYRAYSGDAICYTGTAKEGRLITTAMNWYSGKVFYNVLDVINGEKASESIRNNSPEYFDHTTMGTITLNVSPRDNKYFMVDCPTASAAEFALADISQTGQMLSDHTAASSINPGLFRYSGHSMMAVADNTAEGNKGIKLFDITDGLDNAVLLGAQELPAGSAAASIAARNVATKDAYGDVNGAYINIYVLRDGKISLITTEGVRQPQEHRQHAYAIEIASTGDDTYDLNYKLTGDVVSGNLVLTNTDDDADVVRVPLTELTKGEGHLSFDNSNLHGKTYSAAVEVVSKRIAEAGEYAADPAGLVKRGGVVTITDTESDNLGYTAFTIGGNNGVKIIAPDGTVTGPFFKNDPRLDSGNQSSMLRGDAREGMVVFADWSDKGAGYWVIDPANPVDMTQLLAGNRTADGTGSYEYNGTIIGGGSSCVAFQGRGDNTRMFSFLEDYPAGNTSGSQNKVYCYNIGSDEQITRVPEQVYDNLSGSGLLANQNVEICTTPKGFFAAQCRSEGNNLAGTPGFLYCTNEGEVTFTSDKLDFITSTSAAIAVNSRCDLLAVGQVGRITICSLAWDGNKPVITKLYDINNGSTAWGHLRFDIADNLHSYERENDGYHAYSLAAEVPLVSVAAKSSMTVNGKNDGIENIAVEDGAEGPATYYNLAGVRVSGELAPGVYVRVNNAGATKVIVK